MPRANFKRTVRQVARSLLADIRFQSTALMALHYAAEAYLVSTLLEKEKNSLTHFAAKFNLKMSIDIFIEPLVYYVVPVFKNTLSWSIVQNPLSSTDGLLQDLQVNWEDRST